MSLNTPGSHESPSSVISLARTLDKKIQQEIALIIKFGIPENLLEDIIKYYEYDTYGIINNITRIQDGSLMILVSFPGGKNELVKVNFCPDAKNITIQKSPI